MEYRELLKENQELKEKNKRLAGEIVRLQILLRNNNIDFNNKSEKTKTFVINGELKGDINISKDSSIEEKIKLYRSLFRGREDVFAYRWERKEDKKGQYSPCCINEWKPGICDKKNVRCSECVNRRLKPLTDEDIIKHLNGTKTIGIYPMLKGDRTYFFAIDFDDTSWKSDVKAVYENFKKFNLCPSIELSRSGNGAHLWIFFDEPILASKARYLGDLLMKYTIQLNLGMSLDSYDRFFPNQDKMPKGNFGNLIALPLQRIPAKEGYSLFVDENFNYYSDQWVYLSSIKKNSLSHITEVISTLENELTEQVKNSIFMETMSVYNVKSGLKDNTFIEFDGKVELLLCTGVIINTTQLPHELINEFKKLAIFSNPEYYRRQALRLYLGKTPRFINSFEENEKFLVMPRGCLDDITYVLSKYKISYDVKDERINGKIIDTEFKGNLYEKQLNAYNEILKYDNGILYASTAFGKTVVAISVIAARKTSTLILVNSIELLEQWRTKIETFLDLKDRKVGRLGAGRKKASGFIDVATIQTLNNAENLGEILDSYGQIIIDECHHIAAFTFERVLKQCKAKYVLGLTATIKRRDSLEPIVEYQCGKIRHTAVEKSPAGRGLTCVLMERKIPLDIKNYNSEKFAISDYYELIQKDENRNNIILKDVMENVKKGRNPIVLTERLEHLEYFEKAFTDSFERVVVLRGGMGKKRRLEAFDKLKSFSDEDNFILISTGKYIGEGFDDIRLDTLFLTMPISWEGTIKQYAGRLHRMRKGKEIIKVYDYVDENIPQLLKMYKKRQKGYRNMGYEIEENAGIQCEISY